MDNQKPNIAAISQQVEEMLARKRMRRQLRLAAEQVCRRLQIEPGASHLTRIIERRVVRRTNVEAVESWIEDRMPSLPGEFTARTIAVLADLLELQLNRGTDIDVVL